MKISMKKVILYILAAAMILAMHPMQYAAAMVPGPDITLGSAAFSAGMYYYNNATVTGDNIRTILISFSDNVTSGDEIVLPASPGGFSVSASSAGNDYTKRINLNSGIAAGTVQNYIRSIGFSVASQTQKVQITISTESITQDTFYYADTEHYYQFVEDTSSSWVQAYSNTKTAAYMGRTGYLATVMSLGEDTFINALSGGKTGWLGGTILENTGSSGDPLYYDDFDITSVVPDGWYWACGPEKGTIFYNINSLFPDHGAVNAAAKDALNTTYYHNWLRGLDFEPNNSTGYVDSSDEYFEACLTILELPGSPGKQGTLFSWNDVRYDHVNGNEVDDYSAKGYFVEYGNQPAGDIGSASSSFAVGNGSLERPYTATVNTYVNGAPAAAPGSVVLMQGSTAVCTANSIATGVYTAPAANGTYDIYIKNEDTGADITISSADKSTEVNYYRVNFSVANSNAPGSTVSATAGGTSITSGTAVLAGKTVVMTALGAGASTYTYLWSGAGTGGETAAAITIPSLGGAVNALCTVTGTIITNTATVNTYTDGMLAAVPGSVELKQGSAAVYTLSSAVTGVYTTSAVDGTYDIYISNEDTGTDITISGAANSAAVNYYTVSFSVKDEGTSSGSAVSAVAGVTPISSGTAVLSGKTVVITATGAGAGSYTYLWSGSGTSSQTTAAITIPSLSGTVNALCTVTGTPATFAADVSIYTDGVLAAAPGSVQLMQAGTAAYTLGAGGTAGIYTAQAVNGTYDVFASGEDTGADIAINNGNGSANVNYYTVSFSVQDAGTSSGSTVTATAGGTSISSGTAVLSGKAVTITAAGAGALAYTYLWSGLGTSGETAASLTYPALGGTVNAICSVTGSNILPTYAADIHTYTDGTLAQAPGAVELKQGGTTIYTASSSATGVYTVSAVNGTYDIYINNADTNADITVSGTSGTAAVNYYTVSFSAQDAGLSFGSTVSATVGGTEIASGTAVLAGKVVTLAGHGAGASMYVYAWSGPGTNGEWGQTISLSPLSGTTNVLCRVTGAAQLYPASIRTYADGAPAAAPGSVELWRGGAAMFTGSSSAPGIYTTLAIYGTFDIYINNEDTGVDFTFSSSSDSVDVYYYTVNFAVSNLGTASGSNVSATAGGTPIVSGAAVLPGKAVTITAQGAGADSYAYLWSGAGTSGQTSAAITIPAIAGTVDALCTVTGTTAATSFTAEVSTYSDGTPAAAPGIVELRQGGVTVYTLGSSATGVYTASTANGTYDIYINNEDTGEDITVSGAAAGKTVNYYTVSFSAANAGTASGSAISATAGGLSISNGTKVLAGKAVALTAAGAGADTYTYLWSGSGITGGTTSAIAIPSLSGTVNALCTVTGAANTFVPGTLEEKSDDTAIIAEGLFTQDARLVIIPLAEGEADREALESLLSGKQTAAAFEAHIEPADAFKAPLTLTFQVGQQYNGRSVYILHRLQSGSVEQFTVTVANGEASITVTELSPFLLTVDPPVALTAQPQNVTVITGQTATFTVTATGAGPLAYQWQKKTGADAPWEDIPGAVSSEHTTSQANMGNSGFMYRVIATDAYGRSVTSGAATLTVTPAPKPPATGDQQQPALYVALLILFMALAVMLLRKRKAA